MTQSSVAFEDNKVVISEWNGDESGFVIRCDSNNDCALYEIPQYGGEERYVDTFSNLVDAFLVGRSFI